MGKKNKKKSIKKYIKLINEELVCMAVRLFDMEVKLNQILNVKRKRHA